MTLNYSGFLPADSYDPGGFDVMTYAESSPDRLVADCNGRMILRQGSRIRGIWKNFTYDLSDAIQAYRDINGAGSTTVYNDRCDRRICFDGPGNAYTLAQVGDPADPPEIFLCCSTDFGQTWTAYLLSDSSKQARLEFNDSPLRKPQHPPAVLLFSNTGFYLNLVLPEISNGVVTIPSAISITANKSILTDSHSGASNSVLSIGDDTVVVAWPHKDAPPGGVGTYQYVTVVSRATQSVVSSVSAAISDNPDAADEHDIPAITVDDDNVIHMMIGTHHKNLRYTYAEAPYTTWATAVTVDAGASGQGHTYPALVIDSQNRLHVVTRDSTVSYEFNMVYNRRNADGTWATPQKLVDVGRQYYTNAYHALTIDSRDRLILSSPGLLLGQLLCSLSEEDDYDALWPGELPDLGGGVLPCYVPGGGGTWAGPYTTQNLHGPFILISEDGGDSWTTSQIEDIGMSHLSVRSQILAQATTSVVWSFDDAAAPITSSTGADNFTAYGTLDHAYSQTAGVPELVGVTTSCQNSSAGGFYNGSASANTKPSVIKSIAGWFKPTLDFGAGIEEYIVSRGAAAIADGEFALTTERVTASTAKLYGFWDDGTGTGPAVKPISSKSNSAVITKGTWHFVAMTYDGGTTVNLYVDGQPLAVTDGTDSAGVADLNRMAFGMTTAATRNLNSAFFDEWFCCDYLLTDADVLALYNGYYPASVSAIPLKYPRGCGLGLGLG